MSKGGSKYKLTYFDARARCESIRLLFAAGKLKFDDVRIKQEDWPKLKPSTPLGGMPMLEVGGEKFSESLALARYAAKEAKLYGSTPLEQLKIDMVADAANNLREAAITAMFEKDEAKKAELMEKLKETIATKLGELSKILGKNKFFATGKISFADIHFYACVEFLGKPIGLEGILDKQPTLKALYKSVAENPEIAKYLKARKDTPF